MSKSDMYRMLFDHVLTDEDFEKALDLKDAQKIADQVIAPIIERINEVSQQKNDPKFMAYALIMVLGIK